jgi:hypothetical protein
MTSLAMTMDHGPTMSQSLSPALALRARALVGTLKSQKIWPPRVAIVYRRGVGLN